LLNKINKNTAFIKHIYFVHAAKKYIRGSYLLAATHLYTTHIIKGHKQPEKIIQNSPSEWPNILTTTILYPPKIN